MTKTTGVLGAVAILVIGFILGVLGLKQAQPNTAQPLGAGGNTVFADTTFAGDVFSGLSAVKMLSSGVMVGPINTGSNTVKIGSSGATITNILSGTATYDPPSLADGVVATTTVTVTGAVVGDACMVGFSSYGLVGGINTTCQISTTSVALVTLDNESTVTQNLATGTLKIWTMR